MSSLWTRLVGATDGIDPHLDPAQPRGALHLCPRCGVRVAVKWQAHCDLCAKLVEDPERITVHKHAPPAANARVPNPTQKVPAFHTADASTSSADSPPAPVSPRDTPVFSPPIDKPPRGGTEVMPAMVAPTPPSRATQPLAANTRVLRLPPPEPHQAHHWTLLADMPNGKRYSVRLAYDPQDGWLLVDQNQQPRDAHYASRLGVLGMGIDREDTP